MYWNGAFSGGSRTLSYPHDSSHALATSRTSSTSTASVNAIQTETEARSQIQAIFDSLTAAEDLPEMEADPRLQTVLYKHQRQALHFMVDKETPATFESDEGRTSSSLWIKGHPPSFRGQVQTYKHSITRETRETPPRQSLGGILADDMGLGKTLEVISLILKNQPKGPVNQEDSEDQDVVIIGSTPSSGPKLDPFGFVPVTQAPQGSQKPLGGTVPSITTLIVCPLSTVSNWEDQFLNHVAENTLSIYLYHGSGRSQDASFLAQHDVVITTYNLVSSEFGRAEKENKRNIGSTREPIIPALQQVHWHRIVLDEAHTIKDSSTSQARASFALSATNRWCLTGTPIQNRIDDLYSLIRFIGIEPFDVKATWSYHISKPIRFSGGNSQKGSLGVSRLQTLMKSITLRRTKDQKIDGEPILNVPPKFEQRVLLDLDPQEQALYTKMHGRAKALVRGLELKGTILRNYVHVLEMILRLRQICAHPKLCDDYDAKFEEIEEEIGTQDTGITFNKERAQYILSLMQEAGEETCSRCGMLVETPHVSRCNHLFCADCVQFAQKSSNVTLECPQCHTELSVSVDIIDVSDTRTTVIDLDSDADVDPTKDKKDLEQDCLNASTKIKSLLADLKQVKENSPEGEPPIKSVIFSQWTKLLNLLEPPLSEAGFSFVRLDGAMARVDRSNAIERFKKDKTVTVMLISLRAGGVGLNLTVASRIYLMEPYWNPAVEQQAVDRVHRLGQTRPVQTIRFIARGTIEENMVALQERKMELARMTFKEGTDEGGSTTKKAQKEAMQEQRLAELRNLFR